MKKLFLLRGAPGVGKSTLLKELGVENYALNSDMFRMLLQSPLLTEEGLFKINQLHGRQEVWQMLRNVLEQRMINGDFVIIDATHSKVIDLLSYQELADKYRYEVIVVDFSSIPIEIAKQRNLNREDHKIVPEKIIEKYYKRFKSEKIPNTMKVISYKELQKEIHVSPINLSHYKKIHHIGDIHGCHTALMTYLKEGIKKDELYIFVGDYIDRGVENSEVIRFLISIMNKPNVIFLEGNHERHLWNWANERKSISYTFETETKYELEREGIDNEEVKQFINKLKEFVYYTYDEKEILVTHGGLPVIPKNLLFVSSEQLIKGVGNYKALIDNIFNENEKGTNHYQIHGHRNYGLLPYKPKSQSFNLEGAIDSGGHLRVITLSKEGFKSVQIKNEIYKKQKEIG